MTETRRWLEARRHRLRARLAGASALEAAAGVLLAFTLGVLLGRVGVYRLYPWTVTLGWLVAILAVVVSVWLWRRRRDAVSVPRLAVAAELHGGQRRGLIQGVAAWEMGRGDELVQVADERVVRWLEGEGDESLQGVRGDTRRRMLGGGAACVAGAFLLVASGPTQPQSAPFWNPLHALAQSRAAITLEVDREVVARGGSVRVSISAPGSAAATLLQREPGRPWRGDEVALDDVGEAVVNLGPLTADRFLRAESGRRTSRMIGVRVTLPAIVEFLDLVATFPAYLARAEEPVDLSVGQVSLPIGTVIRARGSVSVPVRSAAWVSERDTVPLVADGAEVSGRLPVLRSGTWRFAVETEGRGALDQEAPTLEIVAVPDSTPTVTIPLPGADTVAPLSMRQALIIDARDDHGVTLVELSSWRASRLGGTDPPRADTISVPGTVTDRALLHWTLDLNQRGFLPGDTAYYVARVVDNAPTPQSASSRLFKLRLPDLTELRRRTRERAAAIREQADSLVEAQEDLNRDLEDLAAERSRDRGADAMPFEAAERVEEVTARQEEAVRDAEALRKALDELGEAAWQSGLSDPAFYQQLAELQDLLDRAVSDELRDRLSELRQALSDLDASQVQEALERLAEAAERLQAELERNRELFERAALEGEMTSLAQDADALAQLQSDWNAEAEERIDSAMATREDGLAEQGAQLAEELEDLANRAAEREMDLSDPASSSDEAARLMARAAEAAGAQADQRARESGRGAQSALEDAGDQLRQRRDELRDQWRREALAALDGALVETADLARGQQELAERMARGETGGDIRGEQAAAREGIDRLVERLQQAGGKHALISPRLGAALGAAGAQMESALEQLQRNDPSGPQAAPPAGAALDALNAVIHAMLQSRAAVEGAESGTGLQEALEQLAQMAEQQSGMNGETGGLLSFGTQGEALMQQLQALAQRERQLAGRLDEMAAGGEIGQAESLAEDARDIARAMEAGRLDRELIERQERLFRRLLDAGRSLRSDEEDEREERVSEAAQPGEVRRPDALAPESGPRYRYPTWEELQGLSPEVRRLILDYFRRLNVRRP